MKRRILFVGIFLNIALIFSLNAQTQPQNPSFEDWEDAGTVLDEPVNWSSIKTSDNTITNPLAPVVWDKSTDAHTGSFSLKLYNVETLGSIVASGTIANARIHAEFDPSAAYVFTDTSDGRWNTPCNDRPDSIVAWFKYYPEQGDIGKMRAVLHTGYGRTPDSTQTNWIGEAEVVVSGLLDTWTRISTPFVYFNNNTPDYIIINIYSGDGTTPIPDSYMLVDDVELIYNGIGVKEETLGGVNIYTKDKSVVINWESQKLTKNAEVKILDITGRTVWTGRINSNEQKTIQLNTPKGIYICNISSGGQAYSQKILIP